MAVSYTMVKDTAACVPKLTAVAPVKLLPRMVTRVPPPNGPELGVRPVTEGAEAAVYVNWSVDEVDDCPLGVVTVRSTVPAA